MVLGGSMWWLAACEPEVQRVLQVGLVDDDPGPVSVTSGGSADVWTTGCGGGPSTFPEAETCTWLSDYLVWPDGEVELQVRVYGTNTCLLEVRSADSFFELEADGTQWVRDDLRRFHRTDPDGTVTRYRFDGLQGGYTDTGYDYFGPDVYLWDVARLPDGEVLVLYSTQEGVVDAQTHLEQWSADGERGALWYEGPFSQFDGDVALDSDGTALVVSLGEVVRVAPPVGGLRTPATPFADRRVHAAAVSVGPDGRVFLLQSLPLEVWAYEPGGGPGSLIFQGRPEQNGSDLAVDADGRLLITDIHFDRVLVVDPNAGAVVQEFTTGLNLHYGANVNVAPCP
jgi:hypothetical protein